MSKLFTFLILLTSAVAYSQECKVCPKPTIIKFFDIEWISIQQPDDSVLLRQWEKLGSLTAEIDAKLDQYFDKNNNCTNVVRVGNYKAPNQISSETIGVPGYRMFGIITKFTNEYQLKIWLQPACSNETLAETEVSFQLYPEMDLDGIATQAASNFIEALNIPEFELKQRKQKGLPIAKRGNIKVDVFDFALQPGQTTKVDFLLLDCDGERLQNKVITFEGTKGGIITPAQVTTNIGGWATATFKMTSKTGAHIMARSVTKNVTGCDALFLGSQALETGLIKVEIEYEEHEERTTDPNKLNPFAAIKSSGGQESVVTSIQYNSIFYHKPSAEARKNQYLIFDEKTEVENFGSVSYYWHESGTGSFVKNVLPGRIGVEVANMKIAEDQQGQTISCSGYGPDRAAQVIFTTGDKSSPQTFLLSLEFPFANDCIVSGGITVENVPKALQTFVSEKITNPRSPYKREYTIVALQDLHKEFVDGAVGMDMFQKGAANITGYRRLKVRVFSPY